MMESNTEEGNLLFTDEYKKALENASYEIVGNHSAVEICGWTKKGLNEETSGCYKQKFYGIRSHQCTQMTPAAVACDQKCVYCWRANEMFSGKQDLMEYAKDNPVDIVQGSIEGHLRKLSGFGGNPKIDKQKLIAGNNQINLDLKKLKKGVYFVSLEIDGRLVTKQIVKQ